MQFISAATNSIQLKRERLSPFVHTVMCAYRHGLDSFGYFDARERSREGLLVHMGVEEFSVAQLGSVGSDDLPSIGVVIPTFVRMADGDVEGPSVSGFGGGDGLDRWTVRQRR